MQRLYRLVLGLSFASALLVAQGARAQAQGHIDQPRGHEHYSVELQPHLVVDWNDYWGWNDGIGVGMHVAIPVIQDGPVDTINNSLAITLGLDWAHFSGCYWYNGNARVSTNASCGANSFWLPIAVQWNFYFSKLISAFPELGLGIYHVSWNPDAVVCPAGYRCTGSDTGVDLVLWLGVRFHLSRSFALTLKLGTPSLLLGASFFL